MKVKILILVVTLTMAVSSFACTTRSISMPEVKTLEKPELPGASTSWEQQWEDLIKAARKEGRLDIRSGLERETVEALRTNFGDKYAIAMQIVTGKSSENNVKLFAERAAGLFLADLYVEGPSSPLLEYKPRGLLQPLDKLVFRPDVLDDKVWWHGYGPYFDKDHMTAAGTRTVQSAVIINTNLINPGEIRSYNDLLDPKWKGKIILGDPTVGGGAQSTMQSVLAIMGEDYIRKLADQIGVTTRDERLVLESVARGKYPLAFGAGTSLVIEFIRQGVPVNMISLKEGAGTTASGVVVLFDRAPNPNAAKLFINWFLTREAQEIYSVASGKMSRRLDVSDNHLLPEQKMEKGGNYIINDEEYYLKRPQYEAIIAKYYKKP